MKSYDIHEPAVHNDECTVPRFSIVIPCYNVEKYLRECLDSVLAQSHDSWEAICVDDGSTDGSGAILDEYAARDDRMRVVHQANRGVSVARNRGLSLARGEWLLFLDGDDVIRECLLERLDCVIAAHCEIALIKFSYQCFDADCSWSTGETEEGVVEIAEELSCADALSLMWQWAFRRDFVGDVRFNRLYGSGEDRAFLLSVLLSDRARTYWKIVAPMYGYRQRQGSYCHITKHTFKQTFGEALVLVRLTKSVARSSKRVDGFYRSVISAGGYCHLVVAFSNFNGEERKRLFRIWYRHLGFVCTLKGLTPYQRMALGLSWIIPVRIVPYCLCYVLPRLVQGGSVLRKLSNIKERIIG